LRAKIYRNTIRVLADRLTDANDLLVRYKKLQEAQADAEQADDGDADILGESSADADPGFLERENAMEPKKDLVAAYVSAAGTTEDPPALDSERFIRLVRGFYEQLDLDIEEAELSEDCSIAMAMHGDGYSYADLEYAVRWTARNIPSARRFNMVRLSIEEAFKDQWDT